MKLKKIASLMLAGIMAVSMLTACDTASNSGDDNGITPPTDDITPAGYSQTILDSTSNVIKSMTTARDSQMLKDAVDAAANSINDYKEIDTLQKVEGAMNFSRAWTSDARDLKLVMKVVKGFEKELDKDDIFNSWDNMAAEEINKDGRYVALYAWDRVHNDTDINSKVVTAVGSIFNHLDDRDGATKIDYVLSVEKAQIGTDANGVVLVGIMVERVSTQAQ